MRQRTRINQRDVVAALLQLNRSRNAIDARANHDDARHVRSAREKLSVVTIPVALETFRRIVVSFALEERFELRVTRDHLFVSGKAVVGEVIASTAFDYQIDQAAER